MKWQQQFRCLVVWAALVLLPSMLLANKQGPYVSAGEGEMEHVEQDSARLNIAEAGVLALNDAMQRGATSSVAITQFYLDRIQANDPGAAGLNAIQTMSAQALADAAALDAEFAEGKVRSLMHGIPVVVKDNYATKGMPTTAGSVLFKDHDPGYDSHAVARLRAAGAVILAKANMHEFAYGITTVGSAFGSTKNPYNRAHNPGGSSGGTGAAIAAGFAVVGMGSDTCGSIRIPAAHNNLYGLRGTQGLSSRYGIVPLSSTQDIGGPLTRHVADLAIALDVTVGVDVKDEQTHAAAGQISNSYYESLKPASDLKVGLLMDWLVMEAADQPVADTILSTLEAMAGKAGWQVTPIRSPDVNEALRRPFDGHYVLIADFVRDMNHYLAQHPDLGFADLQEMLDSGKTHADIRPSLLASLSLKDADPRQYQAELQQRHKVREALLSLFATHDVDVLAYPTIRRTAAKLSEPQYGTNCRMSANSGFPAISIPAGFDEQGLPVGLELLAPAWQEQTLLNAALAVEQTLSPRRAPNL